MYRPERFAYRLITANNKINEFLSYELQYSKIENPKFNDKELFCIKLKFAYEYCWKTMKDYLKFKNNPQLLPRKIFEAMTEYHDMTYWFLMLEDLMLFFSDRRDEAVKDRIISNYYEYYENMFDEFLRFISNEAQDTRAKNIRRKKYVYDNGYILDTYSFVTLINYFLTKPEIQEVYLYGSRNLNTFRESSDVDIIVKGNYTEEQFEKFDQEILNLRIAYTVDVHNQDADDDIGKEFIRRNSVDYRRIYRRSDFIPI